MAAGDVSVEYGDEHAASDPLARLRAERDEWQQRAAEAEQVAEDLAEELARTRAVLAAERAAQEEREHLALFLEPPEHSEPTLSADGSDRGVLPMALAGVSVVAGMVALLSWANSGLFNLFTLFMIVLSFGLGWAAWETRVIVMSVEISRGIVNVTIGEDTHRFDLSHPSTVIEVRGDPEDVNWQVRLMRRTLDPIVIDRTTVYPPTFMKQLREYRPEL